MDTINRREFNKRLATGVLGSSLIGPAADSIESLAGRLSPGTRPNFVFVCSDQHSGKYAGFAGHPLVRTPNLDRIAAGGVRFSATYCGSPLCVPGRSSMMTGMYPSDVNSFCNSTVYDGSYPTWGKRLRDAGYYCWAVGKQDLNPAYDLGFVESGVDHGHARKPDITSLFRRPVGFRVGEREIIDGQIHDGEKDDTASAKGASNPRRDCMDTATALKFLREEAPRLKAPWVAFVGLREPHPEWTGLREYFEEYLGKVQVPQVSADDLERLPLPYQVMRNFKRISTPIPEARVRRAIAAYFSMITELDSYVGQLYRCIEETHQLDHTYFIYTSDHGESLGEHGMWLKNNLYEGPSRVPLVIAGPHCPRGKVIDKPIGHVDLVATMIQWAGLEVPAGMRGSSLMSLIEGKAEGGPEHVYCESHSEGNPTGSCMIRKGDWKMIHFSYYGELLFNLKEDPDEKRDRINDPDVEGVVRELRTALRAIVDPEEVTGRAFAAQEKVLTDLVSRQDEDGLFDMLRGRLGDGQARILAKMLKERKG